MIAVFEGLGQHSQLDENAILPFTNIYPLHDCGESSHLESAEIDPKHPDLVLPPSYVCENMEANSCITLT